MGDNIRILFSVPIGNKISHFHLVWQQIGNTECDFLYAAIFMERFLS